MARCRLNFVDQHAFFPRCYDLADGPQHAAFVQDFRRCAALAILTRYAGVVCSARAAWARSMLAAAAARQHLQAQSRHEAVREALRQAFGPQRVLLVKLAVDVCKNRLRGLRGEHEGLDFERVGATGLDWECLLQYSHELQLWAGPSDGRVPFVPPVRATAPSRRPRSARAWRQQQHQQQQRPGSARSLQRPTTAQHGRRAARERARTSARWARTRGAMPDTTSGVGVGVGVGAGAGVASASASESSVSTANSNGGSNATPRRGTPSVYERLTLAQAAAAEADAADAQVRCGFCLAGAVQATLC